jgi:hypothetical protein
MGKTREAELLLREGLDQLPNHPLLLFELGRIYFSFEGGQVRFSDIDRARQLWRHAAEEWQKQEAPKADPDKFVLEQIQTHLSRLEEEAGNLVVAINYLKEVKALSPNPDSVQARIDMLRQKKRTADLPK